MIRKDSKLPDDLVAKESYSYEYNSATLAIRKDILHGHRVLVIDDVSPQVAHSEPLSSREK